MTSRSVGSFGKAHGLAGEIKFYSLVSDEYFAPGIELEVDGRRLTITAVRLHQDHLLISLEGIRDRNQAEGFRNLKAIAVDPPVLEESEYWLEDLVGLEVHDTNGGLLGTVSNVIAGAAQARLVISGPVNFEIPFVADLVPDVDLDSGRLTVDPPDGLLNPEES